MSGRLEVTEEELRALFEVVHQAGDWTKAKAAVEKVSGLSRNGKSIRWRGNAVTEFRWLSITPDDATFCKITKNKARYDAKCEQVRSLWFKYKIWRDQAHPDSLKRISSAHEASLLMWLGIVENQVRQLSLQAGQVRSSRKDPTKFVGGPKRRTHAPSLIESKVGVRIRWPLPIEVDNDPRDSKDSSIVLASIEEHFAGLANHVEAWWQALHVLEQGGWLSTPTKKDWGRLTGIILDELIEVRLMGIPHESRCSRCRE